MQFNLRTLFAVVAYCCVLFALFAYLGWWTLGFAPNALAGAILGLAIARASRMIVSEAALALAGGAFGGTLCSFAGSSEISMPLAVPAGAFVGACVAAVFWMGLETNLVPPFDRWAKASRPQLIRSARLHLLVALVAVGIAVFWSAVVIALAAYLNPLAIVDPNWEHSKGILFLGPMVGGAVAILYFVAAAIQYIRARGRPAEPSRLATESPSGPVNDMRPKNFGSQRNEA